MAKIAFLDRDGTLNIEINYLHKWADFRWIEGAKDSLSYLKGKKFILAVVSNQSGIARGFYTEEDVHRLHLKMNEDLFLTHGIEIDHFSFCPHHPNFSEVCDCRKPNILMFERIINKYKDVAIGDSIMIGDNKSDMEAGNKLKLKNYLVRTGHGKRTESEVTFKNVITINSITDILSKI